MLTRFPITAVILATTSICSLPLTNANNGLLRKKNLRNPKAIECVILARADLRFDGVESEDFECVLDSLDAPGGVKGFSVPIDITETQKTFLKNKIKNGDLVSDQSTLIFDEGFQISDEGVHVPKGKPNLSLGNKKNKKSGRHLAIVTGDKPILAVKVYDVNGLSRTESSAQISDDIFGTNGDPVNLKSQMSACSFNKLNITAGLPIPDDNEVAPGVIEVTIGISLVDNTRSAIRNAVTTAVTNLLGHSLPGPYQQVMYVLEKCYVDCGE